MSTSIFPPRPLFTLVSYDRHDALSRHCQMVSIVLPYCFHTTSKPFSCLSYKWIPGEPPPYRCLCTHPNACAQNAVPKLSRQEMPWK